MFNFPKGNEWVKCDDLPIYDFWDIWIHMNTLWLGSIHPPMEVAWVMDGHFGTWQSTEINGDDWGFLITFQKPQKLGIWISQVSNHISYPRCHPDLGHQIPAILASLDNKKSPKKSTKTQSGYITIFHSTQYFSHKRKWCPYKNH